MGEVTLYAPKFHPFTFHRIIPSFGVVTGCVRLISLAGEWWSCLRISKSAVSPFSSICVRNWSRYLEFGYPGLLKPVAFSVDSEPSTLNSNQVPHDDGGKKMYSALDLSRRVKLIEAQVTSPESRCVYTLAYEPRGSMCLLHDVLAFVPRC